MENLEDQAEKQFLKACRICPFVGISLPIAGFAIDKIIFKGNGFYGSMAGIFAMYGFFHIFYEATYSWYQNKKPKIDYVRNASISEHPKNKSACFYDNDIPLNHD